jgi:hypothetical protein
MAKNKDRSEIEMIRGENRKLRSQVRHLEKEVSKLSRNNKKIEDLEEIIQEDIQLAQHEVSNVRSCKKCASPKVVPLDLGVKTFLMCTNCKHREQIS